MRYLCQMGYLLAFRGRVFGLGRVPDDGGVLLVSNHQSFLDPVLVTLALHREGNYMARDTLFRNALFRRLIESLNAFPVRRGAADVGAIKEILRRLRDGRVVVTFPEGTRTADGEIRPLLGGSLLVAKRAGCTIVPVVIDGAFEAWPRDCRFPRARPIQVEYGEPIGPAQVAAYTVEDLTEEVQRRMGELLDRCRARRRGGQTRAGASSARRSMTAGMRTSASSISGGVV